MPQPKPAPSADAVLAALRTSRARLVETAASLTAEQLREPSYDSDWSIAQVLSHIGTGAIFFRLILEAGLAGEPAPGTEVMQPIWAEWNAKSPDEQARDGLEADVELIDAVAALDTYQRDDWHIDLFGTERDFTGFLRMRLSEHAVHTWDIAVALDAKAQLPPDSVDVLIDTLGPLAALVGKPLDHQLVLGVETDEPARNFVLTVGADGATLEPLDARWEADQLLALPAEAFIRLIYGRLDPEHAPPGVDDPVLDELRTVFVGV